MRSPSYMLRNGPFSRGRWKPNLGRKGFSVAGASRCTGQSITQRYACRGADIARDSSRRNRERGVGHRGGGLGDRNCPVVHDRSRPASEQACDAEGTTRFVPLWPW